MTFVDEPVDTVKSVLGSSKGRALVDEEGAKRWSRQPSSPLAAKVRPQTSKHAASRQNE